MPSRPSRRWLWVLAAAAVALLAASHVLISDPPRAPATVEALRLALPDVPHAALLHIAAEQGYFVAEGLDVTIVPATHGKAAMEHLRQGRADLAAMADVVFLLSVMRGEALGAVASMVGVSNDNAVVARRDRGIAAPRDLAGKRIGVSFGTSGEYFLWAYLVRNRLAPEAVTLVDVPPGEMARTLAARAVDAVVTWQPIVLAAQAALGDKAVSFAEANVYTLSFLLAGHEDFLKRHPKALEKLMRALLQAEEFNRSRPEDALVLVAARLRVDVNALRPAWKDFDFRVDLRQSLLVTLEDQARWAMARGHVATAPVPNLLPQLHLDALLAVRPERVTVVH